MFKNYFIIGFRSLLKHRFYSIINVAGLAIGLAASLLLVTWIIHELSYDQFHANKERLYRLSLEYSFGGQSSKTSVSPTALLPALEKNFPEVENGVRLYNPSSFNPFIVRRDDIVLQEGKFFFADSTFFQVFSFPLLQGDPNKVLTQPNSVVLTQSTAKKYFGAEDPVGKTLLVNNDKEYLVTGLMKDLPTNSLIQFDLLGSFSSLAASKQLIWWSANYQTFVLLTAGTDLGVLQSKTQALINKELASELSNPGDYVKYNYTLFTDLYLKSDMQESIPVSDMKYVYVFSSIALLILVIACINYVNLATARATERAKEVGVRKVVGAARRQLFFQFIGESVIITTLSLITALLIAKVMLPSFNELVGKNFAGRILFSPQAIGILFIASVGIALFAGAYPAIAITSFKPVQVLKGNFKSSAKGIWLRKALVVFQFSISVILIIGTLVVTGQLNYMQNKKLGYDRDNVVMLPLDSRTEKVFDQLKTEILRKNFAKEVSRATESPTSINGGYSINLDGSSNDQGMIVTAMSVDKEFVPGLGMELAAGRNFTEADFQRLASDTVYSFILNESTVRELMIPIERAIGRRIKMNDRNGEIIGIVKDFHFAPLQKKITPLVLFNDKNDYSYFFVTLKQGNPTVALAELEAICKSLAPHRPFEYDFLDEKYNTLYSNEQRMGKIVTTFAVLTILIACLGLLGLVSFSAAQKTKEIGIRKVMGATPVSIIFLITRDFAKLIVVAFVFGIPLAYWMMNQWLDDFAYRTDIGILPLVIAPLLCLIIAFGTSAYQAIQAAMINPANTLRSE